MRDGFLMPVVALITILGFAVIVKGVMDYFNRRQLIKSGVKPQDLDWDSLRKGNLGLLSNLKWALICLGLGLALLAQDIFQEMLSSSGSFGAMFIGAGMGFLIYYFIAKSSMKKDRKDEINNNGLD